MKRQATSDYPSWQIFRPEQMPVTHWAGGSTRQLAIAPPGSQVSAQDFHWRFSTATVLQDGAFTRFAGYQRLLAIRQGAGLLLQVGEQQMALTAPNHSARFAGAMPTRATLLDGAVVDINLIFAPELNAHLTSHALPSQWQPLADGTFAAMPSGGIVTLLIYADGGPLLLQLAAPAEPPIRLATGELLQAILPSQQLAQICWCAEQSLAAAANNTSVNSLSATSAVLAWILA